MNFRLTAFVYMACMAAMFVGVYLLKHSVQEVQREVATTRRELAVERESLHLLKAEWAYLNRPERLGRLASRHLHLAPMDSRQMRGIATLPDVSSGAKPSYFAAPHHSGMNLQPVVHQR